MDESTQVIITTMVLSVVGGLLTMMLTKWHEIHMSNKERDKRDAQDRKDLIREWRDQQWLDENSYIFTNSPEYRELIVKAEEMVPLREKNKFGTNVASLWLAVKGELGYLWNRRMGKH